MNTSHANKSPKDQTNPSEIPLKQWLAEEAIRTGRSPNSILYRLRYGKILRYQIKERRVNSRVIMVQVSEIC